MNKKQLAVLRDRFSGRRSADLFVSTLSSWYDEKHGRKSKEEIDFINSLSENECPYCHGHHFVHDGRRKDGRLVYLCRDCGRKFNPLSGTLFDSAKITISEWIEYILHLTEYHSIKSSANDNRNARTTGRYWLSKAFSALRGYQDDVVLKGSVYIDETYVPELKGDRATCDGKRKRGLSRDQYCIMTGTDGDCCFAFMEGKGKPSANKARKAYMTHIGVGSTLIHDGEKSQFAIVGPLSLKEEVHPTDSTSGLPDKDNPMEPINRIHRFLKRFLRSHGGYSRDDLQDWLNLFCFIWNTPGDHEMKAQALIEIMLKTVKIMRYRATKH